MAQVMYGCRIMCDVPRGQELPEREVLLETETICRIFN